MPNKHRTDFDGLCRQCELAGLPRPYMNPGPLKPLKEEWWELRIGEHMFIGEVGQCLERALYFVSGYIASIVEAVEADEAETVETPTEPVEIGEFRCTSSGVLRVEVTGIQKYGAEIVMGADENQPIFVSQEASHTLADFFIRLRNQLDDLQ